MKGNTLATFFRLSRMELQAHHGQGLKIIDLVSKMHLPFILGL